MTNFTLTTCQAKLLQHFAVSDEPLAPVPQKQRKAVEAARKDLSLRGLLDGDAVAPAGYVALALRGNFYECADCGHTRYKYVEETETICCKTCDSLWKRVGDTWEPQEP